MEGWTQTMVWNILEHDKGLGKRGERTDESSV